MDDMLGTTYQNVKMSDEMSPASNCDPQYHLNLTATYDQIKVDDDKYQLPYYLNFYNTSTQCMGPPSMGYEWDIRMWNGGKQDAWNTARNPGYGMSYFDRADLPYYFALADEFTIGDQYFQSTFTATNPNRLHQFSGSNGLSVNTNSTKYLGHGVLDDSKGPGINWKTIGEYLEEANITWKVYHEEDDFGCDAFAWFD